MTEIENQKVFTTSNMDKFFKQFFILFGLLFGLSALFFRILTIFGISFNKDNPGEIDMMIFLYSTLSQFLTSIIFVKYIWKRPLNYIWMKRDNFLKNSVIGFLFGFIQISIFVIVILFMKYGKVESRNSINLELLILFIGFFIQSSSEEFLVRGILTRFLLDKFNINVAIIFPSLIFGVLHLLNNGVTILSTVNTILVGLLYAIMILIFKNIWLVSFAHMAWNFSMSAIYGLAVSGIMGIKGILNMSLSNSPLTGGTYGPEGSIIVTFIEIISIILVIIFAKKRGIKWIRK